MADKEREGLGTNPQWKELLQKKLDNELTGAEVKKVDNYLASSHEAVMEWESLCQLKTLSQEYFARLKNEAPKESIWHEVAKQIQIEKKKAVTKEKTVLADQVKSTEQPEAVVIPLFRRRWVSWGSAVAAMIIGVVSFYLFTFMGNNSIIAQNSCIVESVESKQGSVMVFQDEASGTTYIWLLSAAHTDQEKNGGHST